MLCVAIFVLGMLALHAALGAVFHQDFAAREVLLWSLIMVIAGAILAAYDRIVVGGVQASSAVGLDGSRSPASSSGGARGGHAVPAGGGPPRRRGGGPPRAGGAPHAPLA